MGLTLNKVGSRTGWTQGSIMQTSANYPFPAPHSSFVCGNGLFDPAPFSPGTLLFQYVVGHPINDVVDVVNHGDSGAPVFRISNARTEHVELYGILWGGIGSKQFVFSPIGGSPYQPAGIQTDLGPLDYADPCLGPNPTC